MANISKRGTSWQARTNCKGIRQSATFQTKAEALAWAAQIESEINSGVRGKIKAVTFGALLKEYAQEVSPKKRGAKWEINRIGLICRDEIASVKLSDLSHVDVAKWRDRSLKRVSEASVRREWNLLSAAINIAIREWGWLTVNPFSKVKRPTEAPPRDRTFSDNEIDLICHTLGYSHEKNPQNKTETVGAALMFAIETGMRAGEIVALKWSDVDKTVATVRLGKTNAAARKVPLSKEAQRILASLQKDSEFCFGLDSKQIDSLFRKARDKALISDLHFHDSRATAVGRLAKKVNILDLAKMIGHKDLRMLQVYYRDTAEEIAKRLD